MARIPTAYVYDESTGKIAYTIDNISDSQIQSLRSRNIPVFCDNNPHKLVGTYVTKNEVTGIPNGIDDIRNMDFINIDKTIVVANGTDVATVSNLAPGTTVSIEAGPTFVSNSTSNSIEFSADTYSIITSENRTKAILSKYGYNDVSVEVIFTPEEMY